jgi:hypothetical protein
LHGLRGDELLQLRHRLSAARAKGEREVRAHDIPTLIATCSA